MAQTTSQPKMVALRFLLVITLFLVRAACNAVDDVSCANHVHRECKCDLEGVLYGAEWDKKWCNKLEVQRDEGWCHKG